MTKKIFFILAIMLYSLVSYAATPIDSLRVRLGMTQENVIDVLNSDAVPYQQVAKERLLINKAVVSIGSEFDSYTLAFRKNELTEVAFIKALSKNDVAIDIKFSYLSKQLSEQFLLKRYLEKLQDGVYNGWADVNKNNIALRRIQKDDRVELQLVYSSRKLF